MLTQDITYVQFYNTYPEKDKYKITEYRRIIEIFFNLVVKEILTGFPVFLPYLGEFTMKRMPPNKSLDYKASNELKKQGINKPVYRDVEDWFKMTWKRHLSYKEVNSHAKSFFNFEPSTITKKQIPLHKSILEVTYE